MVGAFKRHFAWSHDTPWPLHARLSAPASTRDWRWPIRLHTVLVFCLSLHVSCSTSAKSSGCADGTRDALHGYERVAGCAGAWEGHVSNASSLCGAGWRVCGWYDHALLSNITWAAATSPPGCYAFNAAQDGGRCQECRDDLEQDDLAGIGRDCAHQHRSQSSCITGGRVDSSCCVDAHFHRACSFQPRLMTGALCCRLPVKPPAIVVKPSERLHVYTGLIFLLPCQATGMPPPRVLWYKNGQQMATDNPRISVLSSGDLLVTLARKSDSGLYTCEVINEEGFDMASSYVSVSEYSSGCADGSTEGLHLHRDLQACGGRWEGHVREGRALCRRGWRVCNPRDKESLEQVSWLDVFDLPGCYAYNAATVRGQCRKCKKGKMAAVGRDCQWIRQAQTSCLTRGRVDVVPPSNGTTCDYLPGLTSGVLCCKRRRSGTAEGKKPDMEYQCLPDCENGGRCVAHNRCQCARGYKGAHCQNAICDPPCGAKGVCVRPNQCHCQKGYGGRQCLKKARTCRRPCLNGARCSHGTCRCTAGFWGRSCQHVLQQLLLSQLNRTER